MPAQTIFEKSQAGQRAYSLPRSAKAFADYQPDPASVRESELPLPEVSELDLTRHFSGLAHKNMGIDTHFYPLGSCTMKLNPRVNEWAAALPEFTRTHPMAPDEDVQGNLEIVHTLVTDLCNVCGMSAGSLTTNAGAQGEFIGVRMIAMFHEKQGDHQRTEMLIPDNAHGTNPATAVMAGFRTVPLKTNDLGDMDLDDLRSKVSERTAGLMLTNPNTLGVFSPNILEISKIVHEAGGLLYYDGANLNAILNVARPGEMGFDVMHLNLHKTFSTPHGGGGPGSGPVLCSKRLAPFLPTPRVLKEGEQYTTHWDAEGSVGRIASFHGNFGIYLRAYLYCKLHGHFGLRRIAEMAVLNANYLKKRLEGILPVPFKQFCMHEFVVQADLFLDAGVGALDIAKRLLDYGFHAPTIYFPLIVKECMLIEPTESESKATIDRFVEAMESIVREIEIDPEKVKTAPHTYPVSRLDEVRAARQPTLTALKCSLDH
jgi:glycine dehydrogenase subunit 2